MVCLGALLTGVRLAAQDEPSGPAYLLRLERMRLDGNVCVLVRSDGLYHLERSDWEHTEVFEGDLPQQDLHSLEHWVGENELFDLTQERIVAPLFPGSKDQLALGVNRPGHWQNLLFPSPSTWRPFTLSVVPLAQWFDALQKARHRIKLREEEGRTNCKPSNRPRLSTRSSASSQQTVASFAFMMQSTVFRGKDGEKTCAIVYPDGRFHRETKSQRFGSDQVAAAVYEGAVKTEGMQALNDILTNPDLQNRKEQHLPEGLFLNDGEIVGVILPQTGKARTVFFWKYAPVPGVVGSRGGESGMNVLQPLRQWLQAYVSDSQASPLANAPLTDCVPPRRP